MTKDEAKKWGLIFLAYGFGDKCGVTVKETGINTIPIEDVYVVDSGDRGVSEDTYEIMEYRSPAMPPMFHAPLHWEYEEKEDESLIEKVIKIPRTEIYEVTKILLKACATADKTESDFFRLCQFNKKAKNGE